MQKYVNLVDLVKGFPTSIYLQKSSSIQPRPSLSKFGGKFNSIFIRLLRLHGFGFRKRQDFVAIIPDACRHLDEAKEIRELVRSPELTLRGWTLAATTSSWL